MPVIRFTGSAKATVFTKEDREALTEQLQRELAGEATAEGPVIFEIPLTGTDRIDVLVVWEKWKEKEVALQTRSDMILAAYGEKKDRIAQPLGVTYQEAMEQNLLPYAVVPMTRKHDVPRLELNDAMKRYGGFVLDDDRIDLRFPTMDMAREAHQKVVDEFPKGYWSIVQSIGTID